MGSLLIERHRWRGFSAGRDMFFTVIVVAGFLTVGIYHGSIFDRLREIRDVIRHRSDTE